MPTNSEETKSKKSSRFEVAVRAIAPAIPLAVALAHGVISPSKPAATGLAQVAGPAPSLSQCVKSVPCPLTADGHPVMWWFVFKLNASAFPECGGGTRSCPFGGDVQTAYSSFGQQYAVASSDATTIQDGLTDCLGTTKNDPVGATFDEVYNGNYHYLIWNDQPYGDPKIGACTSNGNCGTHWGHSKGMVAWNDDGEGFVMQVSTPSWPEAGSKNFPRKTDGNTLGCVKDNDVKLSQHFFALRLSKNDLVLVLQGLANASVVTDPTNSQVANIGGPADVQTLVRGLGVKTPSTNESLVEGTLSTGVLFISKPSDMNVPPWQMVSAQLGGVGLRTATFWGSPQIPTTTDNTVPECWDESLGTPGPVQIATSGEWRATPFQLTSGANHAKIGVSLNPAAPYAIFGDENQQGVLSGGCSRAQNGRGGTFYVVNNPELAAGVGKLIGVGTGTTGGVAGAVNTSGNGDDTNDN